MTGCSNLHQLLAQLTTSRVNLGHRKLGTLIGCGTKIKQSIDSDQSYFDRRRNRLFGDSKQILIFSIMPNFCHLKQKHAQLAPVSPKTTHACEKYTAKRWSLLNLAPKKQSLPQLSNRIGGGTFSGKGGGHPSQGRIEDIFKARAYLTLWSDSTYLCLFFKIPPIWAIVFLDGSILRPFDLYYILG